MYECEERNGVTHTHTHIHTHTPHTHRYTYTFPCTDQAGRWQSNLKQNNISGRFRNLERGVQPLAQEVHPKMLKLPRPLSFITTDW